MYVCMYVSIGCAPNFPCTELKNTKNYTTELFFKRMHAHL
jgi:hypothetical protein